MTSPGLLRHGPTTRAADEPVHIRLRLSTSKTIAEFCERVRAYEAVRFLGPDNVNVGATTDSLTANERCVLPVLRTGAPR